MNNTLEVTDLVKENEKLNVFIGKWHTKGDIYDDNGKVTGKVDSIDTYEWLPGKYAVIHYADSRMGDQKIHGTEIIGFDPSRNIFYAPFFDNQGSVGSEEIRAEGETWTWHGENVMNVKYHRCIAVFKDERTITARHERSDDDRTWHTWIDITLRRAN